MLRLSSKKLIRCAAFEVGIKKVWIEVGSTLSVDYKECDYLTTDTRTPHVVIFDGADAGKTAYYLLRWVSTRNEPGAWSPLAQATITN